MLYHSRIARTVDLCRSLHMPLMLRTALPPTIDLRLARPSRRHLTAAVLPPGRTPSCHTEGPQQSLAGGATRHAQHARMARAAPRARRRAADARLRSVLSISLL